MSPLWVPALVLPGTALIAHLVPRLTRPGLLFSVTVGEAVARGPLGAALVRRFRVGLWTGTAVLFILIFLVPDSLVPAPLFAQMALVAVLWARARRQLRPHAIEPATVRAVGLDVRTTRLPGGPFVLAGPFLLLGAAALLLYLNWDAIPERFPSRWSLTGEPLSYRSRTPGGVFGPLVMAAGVVALMSAMAVFTLSRSRQIAAGGFSAAAERRFKGVSAAYLVASGYLMSMLASWMTVGPTLGVTGFGYGLGVLMGLVLMMSIGITIWLVRVGQGGQKALGGEATTPVGDATPDAAWKLGLFYFNPADPALLVEKRAGLGWTLNFGNRLAWLILAAIPALFVLTRLLAR